MEVFWLEDHHISQFYWHFTLTFLARRLWFLTSQTRFTEKHKKVILLLCICWNCKARKWVGHRTNHSPTLLGRVGENITTLEEKRTNLLTYWNRMPINRNNLQILKPRWGFSCPSFQWLGTYSIFLGLDCVWKSNSCSTKSTRFPWSEIKKSEKKIYCSSLCRKENTK